MHNKRSKIKPDEDLPSPGAGSVQVWPSCYSHKPFISLSEGKCTLLVVHVPALVWPFIHTQTPQLRIARVKYEQ